MICSFECTFCNDCVTAVLGNVCPNCGGGFVPRPIRPSVDRKGGNFLGNFPATEARLHAPVNEHHQKLLMDSLQDVPPIAR